MHCLRIDGISIFYKAPQIDLKYFSQFDIINFHFPNNKRVTDNIVFS